MVDKAVVGVDKTEISETRKQQYAKQAIDLGAASSSLGVLGYIGVFSPSTFHGMRLVHKKITLK
jgi:hypothetical protein